jgi:hypothetical protein
MKDITSIIKAAFCEGVLWSVSDFYEVLKTLEHRHVTVAHWVEENWATLMYGEKIIGYLWKAYPLLFVVENYRSIVLKAMNDYSYISVVTTDDLSKREFLVSDSEIKSLFNLESITAPYSAEDFSFYNAT